MNAAQVAARVDEIINDGDGDDERQHSLEDQLLQDIVAAYAPAEVRAQVDRLAAADFQRWCA